jgi:hypothetical protein
MENAPAKTYAVDLLYEKAPALGLGDLLLALGDHLGGVEPEGEPKDGALAFRFPDLADPSREGGRPAGVLFQPAAGQIGADDARDALLFSKDWREAPVAVARHRARVVVSDVRASGIAYKNRLRLFQDVVLAAAEVAAPLGVFWRPSGKIVSPLLLGQLTRTAEKRDPVYGAVSVRMHPDGALADTLGLAAFGLPDFEIGLESRDPKKVGPFLHSLAKYVFDLGDVIPDGRAMKGPDGLERVVAKLGPAARPPARTVLSLRGAPNEGGTMRLVK